MHSGKGYWDRARLSRRTALRSAALGGAGVAALVALGCNPGGTGGQTSTTGGGQGATGQAKRGGTLTRLTGAGTDGFSAGFDPHTVTGVYSGIMGTFYQALLRPDPKDWTVVIPEIAQRWEQRSPTEFALTLAQNVKWHNKAPANGRAMTAEDVVFSLNRNRTNEPRFINRSFLASVDRIDSVDRSTVRITTNGPDATLLASLADLSMCILAPEVVERAGGRFATAETAVGTGAFILQQQDDVGATVVRNSDYWKPGLPYLDSIRFANILDPQAAWAGFLARQVDHAHIPGNEAKKLLEDQNRGYKAGVFKSIEEFLIWPNLQRRPFEDKRVTRALRLLVDHQETVTGWLEPWHGSGTSFMLPHAMEAWDLTPQEYGQTLEWKQPKDDAAREALSLLSAAGYSASNPLRFTQVNSDAASTRAAAQLLQAMWRRLSQNVVQSELQIVENAALVAQQTRGEFDVSGPTTRQSHTDPDQVFRSYYFTNGSNNFGKFSDPAFDQLLDRQRAIFDVAQRKAALKEAIKYLIDNAPYTTFGSRDQPNAWSNRVQDFSPEPIRVPGHQYENVWLDT
jgi:peptide/nickel transport system substrate-binding protein